MSQSTIRRRLLASWVRHELELDAAQARADARRRATWHRLADLRAEQAQLDLLIASLRPAPLPQPELQITFQPETIRVETYAAGAGDIAAPPAAAVQGRPRRLRDGASGKDDSPAAERLSIWLRAFADEPVKPE